MLHCVVEEIHISTPTTSAEFLRNLRQKNSIFPNVQQNLVNVSILQKIIRPHSHIFQELLPGVLHDRAWKEHLEHNDQAQEHNHGANPLHVIELLEEQPREARSEPVRKRVLLFSAELRTEQAPFLQ